MKRLLWKIRYAYHHQRQLKAGWMLAWHESTAWLEDVVGDTEECDPITAVEETIVAWRDNC
jgi:hypothetical protein